MNRRYLLCVRRGATHPNQRDHFHPMEPRPVYTSAANPRRSQADSRSGPILRGAWGRRLRSLKRIQGATGHDRRAGIVQARAYR